MKMMNEMHALHLNIYYPLIIRKWGKTPKLNELASMFRIPRFHLKLKIP